MEELKNKILDATGGGLAIFREIWPDCWNGERPVKFKVRPEENTASAQLFKTKDGVYLVKDFGSGTTINAFTAYMEANNIDKFSLCLKELAATYHVSDNLSASRVENKVYSPAPEGKKEGEAWVVLRKDYTDTALAAMGPFVTKEIMRKYDYKEAEELHTIFVDKKTHELKECTVYATSTYPILVHEMSLEEDEKKYKWQKVYCPKEPDKGKRFRYIGNKPPRYLNGYTQALTGEKSDPIIICAGERDSLNCAGMGYNSIWLNSETEPLDHVYMNQLKKLGRKIIYCGDIDQTGLRVTRELSLKYPEMFSIILPERLKKLKDNRGHESKDLLDFILYNAKINQDGKVEYSSYEFKQLIYTAKRCKFWDTEEDSKGNTKIVLSAISLLRFLEMSGFYRMPLPKSTSTIYIHIDGYKVKEIEPQEIRGYIMEYLYDRHVGNDVVEAFINSKKTGVGLFADLPVYTPNMQFHDHESRNLYFENTMVRVTKDTVTREINKNTLNYTWQEKVIPFNIKLEEKRAIEIGPDGRLKINNLDSVLLRILINASRIYWRKEYEELATGDPEVDKEYMTRNRYWHWGERLSEEECMRQEQFLMNKIYCIGTILHRHKFYTKTRCIWVMESTMTAEKVSSGRSGKSFLLLALKTLGLCKQAFLDGRNRKLMEDQHCLEDITPQTDVMLVDDTCYDFDFDSLYTKISGDMIINPKNKKIFTIEYKDSPNIVVTSNFAPRNMEQPSTRARILPMVYSDYYHMKTEDTTYRESRQISDDFDGLEIFGHAYTDAMRNADYNFLINCLQCYLQWLEDGTFDGYPPMDEVIKRANKAKMGDTFEEWADAYFTPEKLNALLLREEVYTDYKRYVNSPRDEKKAGAWKIALKAYCRVKGFTFNPSDIEGYQSDGRISCNIIIDGERKTKEHIYIRADEVKTESNVEELSF